MAPSPKVATYDLQPEMSAPELTAKAVEAIRSGRFDLIVLNFANADMVGHTGSLAAAIAAVEAVDTGLGRIADAVAEAGGALLVTADHGNAELMRDPATGGPHTAHTTNPVPVFLAGGPPARPYSTAASPTSRRRSRADGTAAAGGNDWAIAFEIVSSPAEVAGIERSTLAVSFRGRRAEPGTHDRVSARDALTSLYPVVVRVLAAWRAPE
jgi:hypothetical protein